VSDDPLLPLGLDSHRYRCCGNGVVAPVAEWLGQRLAEGTGMTPVLLPREVAELLRVPESTVRAMARDGEERPTREEVETRLRAMGVRVRRGSGRPVRPVAIPGLAEAIRDLHRHGRALR
jgi:hypothetical protein